MAPCMRSIGSNLLFKMRICVWLSFTNKVFNPVAFPPAWRVFLRGVVVVDLREVRATMVDDDVSIGLGVRICHNPVN